MITQIFNDGMAEKTLILKELNDIDRSISLTFDTIEARDLFVSQFPKSLKVCSGFMSGYENGKAIKYPYASVYKMGIKTRTHADNKVTGSNNEAGDKRIQRFHAAVKTELTKQIL